MDASFNFLGIQASGCANLQEAIYSRMGHKMEVSKR